MATFTKSRPGSEMLESHPYLSDILFCFNKSIKSGIFPWVLLMFKKIHSVWSEYLNVAYTSITSILGSDPVHFFQSLNGTKGHILKISNWRCNKRKPTIRTLKLFESACLLPNNNSSQNIHSASSSRRWSRKIATHMKTVVIDSAHVFSNMLGLSWSCFFLIQALFNLSFSKRRAVFSSTTLLRFFDGFTSSIRLPTTVEKII